MFFLVEGYDRNVGASYGKVVSTRMAAPGQLEITVKGMIKYDGANAVMITETSEEVFQLFFQDEQRRVYTHDGHKRRED